MNGPRRIGVFYGKGRTFLDALKSIKSHDPAALVCAIVPAAYPISEDEIALTDEILETDRARYGARDIVPFLRLIRQLRGSHYDAFVILFDSPRQRILASLVRARQRSYCRLDGKVVELEYTIPGVIGDAALRNLWGRIVYALLWVLVRLFRAPPPARIMDRDTGVDR